MKWQIPILYDLNHSSIIIVRTKARAEYVGSIRLKPNIIKENKK